MTNGVIYAFVGPALAIILVSENVCRCCTGPPFITKATTKKQQSFYIDWFVNFQLTPISEVKVAHILQPNNGTSTGLFFADEIQHIAALSSK